MIKSRLNQLEKARKESLSSSPKPNKYPQKKHSKVIPSRHVTTGTLGVDTEIKTRTSSPVYKLYNSKSLQKYIFYLLLLLLPTQLGKHYWPNFSLLLGIRVDYLSPTLYLTDILIAFLFLSSLRKNLKSYFVLLSQQKLILFFLSYLLIGVVLSGNVLSSGYGVIKMVEYIFLAKFIANYWKESELSKIFFICAIAVIGETILEIAQYLHQGSIGGIFYFLGERSFTADTPGIANAAINGELILRPYATFSHPNVLAGYLLVMAILIAGHLKQEKNIIIKTIEAVSLIVGSIGICLTLSRIAILLWAFLAISWAMIITFQKVKKKLTIWKKFIPFFILGGILLIFIIWSPLAIRFEQTNLNEESFIQREDLIESSLKIIEQHPLIGVGIHNFLPSLALIRSSLSPTYYLQPVHNIFLLWTAETGIIGLGFLLLFVLKTIQQLKRKIKEKQEIAKIYLIIFFCLVILGMFDHYLLTLQQGQLLTSFVFGLAWLKPKYRV